MNFLEIQGLIGLIGFLVGISYVIVKRSKENKK